MTSIDTTQETETTLKFEINASKFANALQPVITTATKGVITESPGQSLIKLEATKNSIDASAFGGRLACTVKISEMTNVDIDYKFDGEGSVAVHAIDFKNALESFPPDCKVILKKVNKELYISKSSDESEYQSVPLCNQSINVPKQATKFVKKIKINRAVFLQCLKNMTWALGYEDHKDNFLYWRITASKNFARFAAGSGARFSLADVKGPSFIDVKNKVEIFIPNELTAAITGIIAKSNDEELTIGQSEADGESPAQILFSLEGSTVMIVGFNPAVKWQDIDAIVKRQRNSRIRTKVSDWEYPTKGLMATFTEEIKQKHDNHESELEVKIEDGFLRLTSKTGPKSSRKVPIADVLQQGEESNLSFLCSTSHLAEIFRHNNANEDIEIEYEDASKPVIVTAPETPNESLNVKFQNIILFGTLRQ